jgi:hypothetical protein
MANRPELQNELHHRGIRREIRNAKRAEAEERSKHTAPVNCRAYWKERGFRRESDARRTVWDTVFDINEQAATHKQRSADWPLVPDEVTEFLNKAS